ncbi:DEAD/DEAH box helicase [Zoogloea sp.]|uniref:DEAD/DEAH box helicase n=1 Tax=Zoogloea sp. TaxID=49181 RepID=UPI00262DF48A|nr:DEAD/DEAH box helicase [Zoogloea sp.]MDD3352461.1 DEAD/DEAH box helicase [Zoogloea sp.]
MEFSRILAQLDDTLLRELFSAHALAKGRTYVGRVRNIETAGHQIQGLVQGTEPVPYRVSVRVDRRDFFGECTLELATRCSCPVGNRCKHAVALILASRRPGALVDKPRAEVLAWAKGLRERVDKAGKPTRKAAPSREAILYLLTPVATAQGQEVDLSLLKARMSADDVPSGAASEWYNYEQALLRPPGFVREDDLQVFRLLRGINRRTGGYGRPELLGAPGMALLESAVRTGRTYLQETEGGRLQRLNLGGSRPGRLVWQPGDQGVCPQVRVEPSASLVIRTLPLAYFDFTAGEVGPVSIDQAPVVTELLTLPPLSRTELPVVTSALADVAPELPSPQGDTRAALPLIESPCQPVLSLTTLYCWSWRQHRGYPADFGGREYDVATPFFCYDEARFEAGSTGALATLPDGRAVRVKRDLEAEARAWKAFQQAGFLPLKRGWLISPGTLTEGLYGLESEDHWAHFFALTAPALQEGGWRIDAPRDFRHRVLVASGWEVSIEDGDEGWLEVALGVEVEGRRVDLAPMLHAVFRQDPRWLDPRQIDAIADDSQIIVQLDDGDRVALAAERVKPLARTLVDLFDSPSPSLRISLLDAPRLADGLGKGWQARGMGKLEEWVKRIRGVERVKAVSAPKGFAMDLRPYQLEGLAWLQHLRKHELGGILADDMGLGKTAQTLAHLLTEKRGRRLGKPALVVLPTSLVFNWQREAERCAPALKVLSLRGKARAEAFARIPEHDVCLTTYPLLWRDREQLAAHEYHSLILDEAQTVKNAASQAAQVVRILKAQHRLCLTGTPLENHLGELWSQFDFLLPGFLGEAKDFTARWRTPIEKHGDTVRRDLLARRIAPFILRRRKEQVATELPPKTVVVRTVELEGRQRDLYETVRISMDKKVRDEIAARGFARSQIVILDALLKLRQVCCDPRLLKTEAALKVRERAKLGLLMDMLPELVEEGRKVLVFSQFTAMLALIAAELTTRRIEYVTLTGDTGDREAPVKAFQEGAVPVFLISLKAGGVGLNLTAADTVIHYDPWWNPAAENQATDRAHRLGQDKAVFVYKLVVAGSIEEKILGLQERKAELAAGILSEDRAGAVKFGETDIQTLLAPLPEVKGGEDASSAPARRGRPRKAATPAA